MKNCTLVQKILFNYLQVIIIHSCFITSTLFLQKNLFKTSAWRLSKSFYYTVQNRNTSWNSNKIIKQLPAKYDMASNKKYLDKIQGVQDNEKESRKDTIQVYHCCLPWNSGIVFGTVFLSLSLRNYILGMYLNYKFRISQTIYSYFLIIKFIFCLCNNPCEEIISADDYLLE